MSINNILNTQVWITEILRLKPLTHYSELIYLLTHQNLQQRESNIDL
ncbi:MAG: hypothetical protein ACI9LX_004713 [Paraglaciecola sp.]|jgi:hypothetical protein